MSVQNTQNIIPRLVQEVEQPQDALDLVAGPPELAENVLTSGGEDSDTIIRVFAPNVVTRFGGTLPWDTTSKQTQCGQTVTDASGDMNIRLVYHCVCTKSEFETLVQMRSAPQAIEIVSAAYTGPVTFDQLKFDRIPDENGTVVPDGVTEEPKYEIQLQSKENSEDEEDDNVDLFG